MHPALVSGCECDEEVEFEIVCEADGIGTAFFIYLHYCGKTVKQKAYLLNCECSCLVEYKFELGFQVKLWPNVGCDCVEYPSTMNLHFYCQSCSCSESASSESASESASDSASDSESTSPTSDEPGSGSDLPFFSEVGEPISCSGSDEEAEWDPQTGEWYCKKAGTGPVRHSPATFRQNNTMNPWFM
jgi:hypothetical protein